MKKFLSSLFLSLFALTLILINPASAESGYRYWGYFQAPAGATTWTAAMTGPSVKLKDGDVEGWAFTASSNDIPATAPMMDPDFAALCSSQSAVAGKIRVGLVVDFGSGDIAPQGETPKEFFSQCVTVPEGSTGLDVLQAAFKVRADKSGLICSIAGYPANECGAPIEMPSPSPSLLVTTQGSSDKSAPEKKSNSVLPIAIVAAFAVTLAAIVVRRRSK